MNMKYNVFVYGTLMKKMKNNSFLFNSKFLGSCEIDGYNMYNLGLYPGIVEGNGKIKGEVYEIDRNTLNNIDILEGNGYLYTRTQKNTKYGLCYVYIYNKDVKGLKEIPYDMQPYNNLVYYVAYGSNLLEERFLTYIKGGLCKYNNRYYEGCTNKCNPIDQKSIIIPYTMYFSKYSNSWGGAVAFLDNKKGGKTFAKAYLITKEQFEQIKEQEGNWYDKTIELDSINGFKVYTFTSSKKLQKESFQQVNKKYKEVLKKGIKESFKDVKDDMIDKYLIKCGTI